MNAAENNGLLLDWEFSEDRTKAYGVVPVFGDVCMYASEVAGEETDTFFTDTVVDQMFTALGFRGGSYRNKTLEETLILALRQLEEFLRDWVTTLIEDSSEFLKRLSS